jgi:hypothetical protein
MVQGKMISVVFSGMFVLRIAFYRDFDKIFEV